MASRKTRPSPVPVWLLFLQALAAICEAAKAIVGIFR